MVFQNVYGTGFLFLCVILCVFVVVDFLFV